jgi:hypothetical protein
LPLNRVNQFARQVTTTTVRPFSPLPPVRSQRPILDGMLSLNFNDKKLSFNKFLFKGLSWLWQQWQETAPNYRRPTTQSRPVVQTQSSDNFDDQAGFDDLPGESGGLNYPQVRKSIIDENFEFN